MKFEVTVKPDLVYVHAYTAQAGHTCIALEPRALDELIELLAAHSEGTWRMDYVPGPYVPPEKYTANLDNAMTDDQCK
jgi:hypothetical protein